MPGEGGGVLAEVAAQPERADEVVAPGELAHDPRRAVRAAVVDQDRLDHPGQVAVVGHEALGQRLDVRDQGGEVAFAPIDGDYDRDAVLLGRGA